MRCLLSPAGMAVLRRFAQEDTLIGLDYDGTLAALRRSRDAARLSIGTKRLLSRVSQRYPTVVITGRARDDATRLLKGLRDIEIIGNHGAETAGAPPSGVRSRVAAWRRQLDERLPAVSGLQIEDKRYSLSLHYRACTRKRPVRAAILAEAERLAGVRIVEGKAVVNLVPLDAPHKGTALMRACSQRGSPRAIYVGDDVTDEDVFALNRPDQVLGVRVGYEPGSAARYYVHDRSELHSMLRFLLALPATA